MSGVSLVGLPALQALLYHCQYFQHVSFSASNCYQGRYTFHLQSCADTICGPSTQERNLLGRSYVCVNLIMWIWSDCILEQVLYTFMCHMCGWLDSESSLWFWRSDPPASTINSRRPSSSLSTSSTVVSNALAPSDILIYILNVVKKNKKCYVKPNGSSCRHVVHYRLEVQGYIPQRVPLHWTSQKIPLQADWWLKVLQSQIECFYVCSCAFILTVTHHGLHLFPFEPYCGHQF